MRPLRVRPARSCTRPRREPCWRPDRRSACRWRSRRPTRRTTTLSRPRCRSPSSARRSARRRRRSARRSPARSTTRPGIPASRTWCSRPTPTSGGCSRCRRRTMRSAIARSRATSAAAPDLATATWSAKAVSPTLANVGGATSSVLAGGRSLGVAVRSIAGVDYAHVFVSTAFDGQVSSNGHSRATLGATTISWGAWNNPGSPNAASEWQGPLNSGNPPSAAATHTSWGNSIGISTGGFIHHFSVTMDQEVDCAVGRSTNADTTATWTNWIRQQRQPDRAGRHVAAMDDRGHRQDDDERMQGDVVRSAGIERHARGVHERRGRAAEHHEPSLHEVQCREQRHLDEHLGQHRRRRRQRVLVRRQHQSERLGARAGQHDHGVRIPAESRGHGDRRRRLQRRRQLMVCLLGGAADLRRPGRRSRPAAACSARPTAPTSGCSSSTRTRQIRSSTRNSMARRGRRGPRFRGQASARRLAISSPATRPSAAVRPGSRGRRPTGRTSMCMRRRSGPPPPPPRRRSA